MLKSKHYNPLLETQMTDQDYTADDLNKQLYSFLQAEARRNHSAAHPLTFKYDGKGKLTDSTKRNYEIDMAQLESFKDHFTDKPCILSLTIR